MILIYMTAKKNRALRPYSTWRWTGQVFKVAREEWVNNLGKDGGRFESV